MAINSPPSPSSVDHVESKYVNPDGTADAKGRDTIANSVNNKPIRSLTVSALFVLYGTGLESLTQDFDCKIYIFANFFISLLNE